jgi:hypothetical protein
MHPTMTTAEVGRELGMTTWQVRRLFERRLLAEPARCGPYRAIRRVDLPKIRRAAAAAGYLEAAGAGA